MKWRRRRLAKRRRMAEKDRRERFIAEEEEAGRDAIESARNAVFQREQAYPFGRGMWIH